MKKVLYLGEDCMEKFFEALDEIREMIMLMYDINVLMKELTEEQQEVYDATTTYWICKKEIKDKVFVIT